MAHSLFFKLLERSSAKLLTWSKKLTEKGAIVPVAKNQPAFIS